MSQCNGRLPPDAARLASHAGGLLGYFSIDAALALVMAVIAYSSFAHLAASAGASASQQSREIADSLLALQFSSFALEQSAASSGGFGGAGHASANEIDAGRLDAIDFGWVQERTGKNYSRISVSGSGGEIFSKEAGVPGRQTFCARRLALLSGEIVRLEACLS